MPAPRAQSIIEDLRSSLDEIENYTSFLDANDGMRQRLKNIDNELAELQSEVEEESNEDSEEDELEESDDDEDDDEDE